MNKQTSNTIMEREFDILQSIQGLQPPAHLYNKIMEQTSTKVMTVSKKLFAGAAATLVILMGLEILILLQTSETKVSNEIETLVQQENHQLYE